MGIKGLLPFLKANGALRAAEPLAAGTRVAIDVPIFAHKFIYAEKTYEGLLRRFHKFANDLVESGLVPTFVFDGLEKLELKNAERLKRAAARDRQLDRNAAKLSQAVEALAQFGDIEITENIYFTGILFPTKHEYALLMDSLKEKYNVAQAKFEAEALCAHLNAEGLVDLVITEDTDVTAFGCKRAIFKWTGPEMLEYRQDEALKALGLTMDQYIDLCALFGCDFCENIYKIGPITTFNLIKKHGSWPEIYSACRFGWTTKTRETCEIFQERYAQVVDCFKSRANEI
jgi:exonuclease-1